MSNSDTDPSVTPASPQPQLPPGIGAARPLSSIIPANWSSGMLRPRLQPVNINPVTGNPYNPARRSDLAPEQPPPDPNNAPSYQRPDFIPPYIRAAPRPIDQIGEDPWNIRGALNYPGAYAGPGMPSTAESFGIMAQSGRALSMFGPTSASPYYDRASRIAMQIAPWMDILSHGKFSKYYTQEKLGQLKLMQGQLQMMQDEMLLNMQQGLMTHQQDLMKYNDIFRTFNSGGFDKDPLQNELKARAELEELAQGNPHLLGVLHNNGIIAMQNQLQDEDAEYRNNLAAWTSAKKARDAASGGANVFEEGGSGGSGIPQRAEILHPAATAATKPATGTDEKTGISDKSSADVISEIKKSHANLNDSGIGEAEKRFRGELSNAELRKIPPDPNNPRVSGATAVGNAAADMQHRFDTIAADPRGSTADKIAELEKFAPGTATDLREMLSYDKDPKDFSTKNNYRSHMQTLASRIDPSYKPAQFPIVHDIVKAAEKPLVAAQLLDDASNVLLKAANKFKENEKMPTRWLEQVLANQWTGDAKYREYGQALTGYAQAVSRSESGVGRAYATTVNWMLHHLDQVPNPSAVRAMIKADNALGRSYTNSFNKQFQTLTGSNKNIPGWRQDIDDNMNAKAAMTDSGEMPDWAPDSIKALGRTPGVEDRSMVHPLTRDQISRLQGIINDPSKTEEQKQRARKYLSESGVLR